MVLKPELLDALTVLGIAPDTDRATATKAYKRLALIHHPDRNNGGQSATQRFQEIGAAWNICQRHYDNPAWSHVQEPSNSSPNAFHFSSDDDDIPLDDEDLHDYYMYMFAETLFDRFSRAKGQRYRYERSGAASSGLHVYDYAQPQQIHASNAERQMKEKQEYEKRKRKLELEIEHEQREQAKVERKMKADEDRKASAMEHAFQAASVGNSVALQNAVLEFNLDVNAPRRRNRQARKQEETLQHETLLHVAASHCDETTVMFLLERGAKSTALNNQQLTPFHAAILAGNTSVVRFIMDRRGRSFEGYHPSKASASGRTPLQLAIASGVASMVQLFIKDATTHDVERCWNQDTLSEEIKDTLKTKKGFVPPEDKIEQQDVASIVSKKAQRQQELAKQKEARIAEELERAEINRQKKEERAAKRLEKDREVAALKLIESKAQRKAETEERQRIEALRRAQEEKEKAEAHAEALTRLAAEEKQLREEKEEQEKRLKDEQAIRLRAEDQARSAAQKKRIQEKKEVQSRAEAQAKHPSEGQEAKSGVERLPNRRADTRKSAAHLSTSSPASAPVVTAPPAQTPNKQANSKPVSDTPNAEERKAIRLAKLKAERKAKQLQLKQEKREQRMATPQQAQAPSTTDKPQSTTSKPPPMKAEPLLVAEDMGPLDEFQRKKHEDTMRKRAEQSARDKARHQRAKEERANANAEVRAGPEPPEYVPLTPVSTHDSTHNDTQGSKRVARKPGASTASRQTRTPQSKAAPSSSSTTAQPAFNLPLEDIQTVHIPDDLFLDERSIRRPIIEREAFVQTSQPQEPPHAPNDQARNTTLRQTSAGDDGRYRRPYRGLPRRGRHLSQQVGTNL
ncbi:hypothetical protein B0H34DRAFT_307746 [Crassisporium funariophilum]|nr:hypothetical protein B0H34DRAFT_307746 [Crassisporium funariophilum]